MNFSEADAGGRYNRSLILTPSEIIESWGPATAAELTREHLTAIANLGPRVVLIGTGKQPALLDPTLYLSLLERGIGVEVMTTGAACRTYNILMAEGREVVAGLILESNG